MAATLSGGFLPQAALSKEAACQPLPDAIADALLRRTNAERAAEGRKALTSDPALARAAQAHSCDMARRGYLSHTTPEGLSVADRAHLASYRPCQIGENIAQGQRTALHAFNGWMRSPGHRRTVMMQDAQHVGFGASAPARAPGGPRWVMIVARACQ